jgi:hypothetical protein
MVLEQRGQQDRLVRHAVAVSDQKLRQFLKGHIGIGGDEVEVKSDVFHGGEWWEWVKQQVAAQCGSKSPVWRDHPNGSSLQFHRACDNTPGIDPMTHSFCRSTRREKGQTGRLRLSRLRKQLSIQEFQNMFWWLRSPCQIACRLFSNAVVARELGLR